MAVNQRQLRRLLDPLRNRLRLLVTKAIVTMVRDDEGRQILQLKGLDGQPLDKVERFQEYGSSSVPLPGAEAIVLSVLGAESHGVAIAVDDRRYRPRNLQPGEKVVYTDEGDEVRFKRGKIIAVTSGGKVKVTAPEVVIDGATKVEIKSAGAVTIDGGTVILTGTTTIEGKAFLPHQHSGVETGAGNTGGVV